MPISRYEIRNEYSLADSEVYRAADKDDPEALLEGVAMAGLVGLLRQLGDLAEFAADIFHNLHEEVMATAARGHGLMSRVQQLETEIPSIERAFLSQTDHSSLFYHPDIDWHPNLRLDQNIVTQGDLPRFIMDSYEESRAPPRLFLLDKYDVAGAGSCLKRYTDPSFFKVETSEMIGVDVQREKKIRKTKKKGPRWRNGETAEVLPTSHSKLHQLFLEERAENGDRNPSHRVKLKRRLNGFPFDLKTGKGYMEKLLKSPSPDHKVLREVTMNSSLMMSVTNDHKESGSEFEIFEARRSPPPYPYGEENAPNPSIYEPNKPPINDELSKIPSSYPSTTTYDIPSTLDNVTAEKVVSVDTQSQREDGLTGYQSDEIASEIDNYVDAPSSIESEMDGDSESRVRSDLTSSIIKNESLFSDADEEHLRTRSTDSQSTGGPKISSDYPSTSVENPREDNFSAQGFDASSYQETADEDFQVDHQSRPVTDAVNEQRSEFKRSTSLCSNGSIPALSLSDSEDVVRKCMLKAPESDEIVSTLNDKEEKANMVLDPLCSPSHCDFESQSREDLPGSSAGEPLVDKTNDESLPCVSTEPYTHYHSTDSPLNMSSYSLHEDAFDGKDRLTDLSRNVSPETISSKNQIPSELENEVPKVSELSPNYPDTAHNGHSVELAVSKEDNLIDGSYDEDSNGSVDSPSHFPSIMRGSSYDSTDSIVENNPSHSSINVQISSEDLNLSDPANSPDRPTEGLDTHAGDVIPEETTKKETLALETLELSEVVGSQGLGLTHHIFPSDSEALESSCCIPEDLDEPAGTEDAVEMDGVSADLISMNKLLVLLDKCDADNSNTTDVPAVSDGESLGKLVEEHDNCFEDSGTDGLNNDENCPSECHEESDIVEKVGPTEASASGSETGICNSVIDYHPKSELSCIIPNSDLVLEVDHGPKMEQCGVDTEHDLFNQSGLENHAPEESIAQEKIGLPLCQLDQELVHPSDTSSELSRLLPINHQPMLDHVVFSPNNPFPETNQMNLGDLPPLPPLPPVEWRMGNLQHASSSIEGEMVRPMELSSQLIFPPTVPSDHVDLSPPTASPNVIKSSLEENMHHTLTEIYPETSSMEEKIENDSSSLEANALHETTDLPPKDENEQQQFVIPNSEGIPTSAAEEHGTGIYPEISSKKETVESGSSGFDASTLHETTYLPPKVENEQQQIVIPNSEGISTSSAEEHGTGIYPEAASKMESIENNSSSLEANTLHETTDLPPKVENKQQQIFIPNSEGISTSAAEEHGNGIYPETASKKESIENSSSGLEANTLHDTTDLPPKVKDEQQQIVIPFSESISTSVAKEDGTETASKNETAENSSSGLEANTLHETTDLPPKVENKQPQIVIPIPESVSPSTAKEDGAENGNRTVKPQWPRNPVIEDAAFLNTIKLRKVTERVRPEIHKVDERDSFLNQIRTKSFNLRPAKSSRPSIRGPNTNPQVAAILEKANSIRQALAGSDEDDSDSWSDS